MKDKKTMLVVGPGFGHNAEGKMRTLNQNDKFDVTFLGSNLDYKLVEKYPNIRFIPFIFALRILRPFSSLYNILKLIKYSRINGGFDVLYVLGLGRIHIAAMYFFTPKKTIKAFEIWSNTILDSASGKGLFSPFDRYIIKNTDYFCQYWWGIKEKFDKLFPEYSNKFIMYQLSYPDIYFSNEHHEPKSDFVKSFLESIPEEQIVCFWPRSIIKANNHELAIDALNIVKNRTPELLENFRMYLWDGNIKNNSLAEELKSKVKQYSLQSNVEFLVHPFVPTNDIFAIEERSDMFIQIAREDVLSTFIMEILCSTKPFILSNIRTFQFLNEKYGLDIPLIDNDVEKVADAIIDILSNKIRRRDEKSIDLKSKCEKAFSRKNVTLWYDIFYNRLYSQD